MNLQPPNAISRKPRRILVAAALVSLLLVMLTLLALWSIAYRHALVSHFSVLTQAIGRTTSLALEFGDEKTAVRLLEALRADPDVRRGWLMDADGALLAIHPAEWPVSDEPSRASPGDHPDWIPALLKDGGSHRFTDRTLQYAVPILSDGERIGSLAVEAALVGFHADPRSTPWLLLGILVSAATLARLLSEPLQHRVGAPMSRLLAVMEPVTSEPDYRLGAAPGAEDDIGRLIAGFNDMLGRLGGRDQRLVQPRQGLGGEVADRDCPADPAGPAVTPGDWPETPGIVGRSEALELRVLVAEDNPVNRELAEAMLRQLGCRTTLVCDGRAAIEASAREPFDLILMDCQMPRLDGYEATRRIRARDSAATARRLPVIALTAHAMTGDRERCLAAGMDDYLAKPISLSQLRETLRRWSTPAGRRPAGVEDPPSEPAETQPLALPERADGESREAVAGHGGSLDPVEVSRPLVVPSGGPGSDGALPDPDRSDETRPVVPERKPLILIVDDDRVMHPLADSSLDLFGFECVGCLSGQEALEAVRQRSPDLVVLDVMMPGMDGFETCRRLRAEPQFALIPILMVTGLDDIESIERAYEAGATDFLAKPLNWSLLVHRIRYLLRGHATLAALHRSEARQGALISAIPDALLRVDRQGRILHFKPGRVLRGLGDRPEASVTEISQLLPPSICAVVRQEIAASLEDRSIREIELERPDGDQETLAFDARFIAIDADQVIILLRDISERRRRQRVIQHLAYRDGLTGLANRQQFNQDLAEALKRASRRDDPVAVLFLDLDQFKRINDSLGHGIGDELLRGAAARLEAAVDEVTRAENIREGTLFKTVARLGGDELTVLLSGEEAGRIARLVAERVIHRFREPFDIAPHSIVCTLSVGIALCPEHGDSAEILLKHADTAMYVAKLKGRNTYRVFTPAMGEAASRKLDIEARLRRALERGEFVLDYQPIVHVETGETLFVEALLRWLDPERGLIGPDSFIQVAEESGLILPLGAWVIDEVGRQLGLWSRQGLSLGVSLNLSARQFSQWGLVEHLLDVARGLPPRSIQLEITESLLLDQDAYLIDTLARLRAQGLRIAIDDFGTGYSSLAYLQHLPIDTLKIDRSFVHAIGGASPSDTVVRTIISLANGLGLEVVAEGVETEEQYRFLVREGCLAVQGYLFARPLAADRIQTYLLRGHRVPGAKAVYSSVSETRVNA